MQPDFSQAVDLSQLKAQAQGHPNVRPMVSQVPEEDNHVYKWEDKFFCILMWPDRPPAPTDSYDSRQDAVKAAKKFRPVCDAFEVKQVTARVDGQMVSR